MKAICVFFICFVAVSTVFCQNDTKSKWTGVKIKAELANYGKKEKISKEDYEKIVEKGGFIDEALRIAESSNPVSDENLKNILKIETIFEMCIADTRLNQYIERINKIKANVDSDIKKKDILIRFENYLGKTKLSEKQLIENTLLSISQAIKAKDKNKGLNKKTASLLEQRDNIEFLLKSEKDYIKKFPEVFKLLKELDQKLKK